MRRQHGISPWRNERRGPHKIQGIPTNPRRFLDWRINAYKGEVCEVVTSSMEASVESNRRAVQ